LAASPALHRQHELWIGVWEGRCPFKEMKRIGIPDWIIAWFLDMNIREQFKIEFDSAFNWLKLSSERGKDLQVDLVLINDALGGPLYSILKSANYDFVFQNGHTRFPGVTTIEDFRAWGIQLAQEYKKGVEDFETSNAEEEADRRKLLEQADAMHRAAELAYQIQKEHLRK
jgi:hypothetical protein